MKVGRGWYYRSTPYLESGHGHSYGAGVELGDASVGLVASLPYSKVRNAVGRLDVVDQVLDEGHLEMTRKSLDRVSAFKDVEQTFDPLLLTMNERYYPAKK